MEQTAFWKKGLPSLLFRLGGVILFLIGSITAVGWYTHNPTLIQMFLPNNVMVVNTALAIASTGLAFLCFERGFYGTCRCFSAFPILITFLILLQYVSGLNLGIDELFHAYDIDYYLEIPGRMAPNAATLICLSNLSLFLFTYKESEWCSFIALVFMGIACGISWVSMLGTLLGFDAVLSWGHFPKMAVHTAVSGWVMSSVLFFYAILLSLDSKLQSLSFPITAFLVLGMTTLTTWKIFQKQEYKAVLALAQQDALHLIVFIEETIQDEILALERMKQRWEALDGYSQNLWEVDAQNYVQDLVGFNGLRLYSKDLKVVKEKSRVSIAAIPSLDTLSKENWKDLKNGRAIFLPSQRKDHLLVFDPLMRSQEFDGMLVAELNLEEIFRQVIGQLHLGNYLISLVFEQRTIFSDGNLFSPVLGKPLVYRLDKKFPSWEVRFFITESVASVLNSKLVKIVLFIGILGALIIGVLVSFGQSLLQKKKELQQINDQLLETTKKAESAEKAKSVFLATMSHEIRTPLNAVIGTVDLLLETEATPMQKKYFLRINHAGKTLLNLINDVLDISKLEAGGMKLECVPSDLWFHMKAVADNLQLRAREKNIDIFVDLPSQAPPHVYTDPLRLEQVLYNLGNNALKFTEQGSITFRLRLKAQIDSLATFRFEVIDTGIGISTEDEQRLFSLFSQLNTANTRKHGGVGLGLFICKKLIEMMGGQMGLISEKGKGSTFWVEVPYRLAPEPSSKPYVLGSKTVWLIDEKKEEGQILRRYFEEWGAKVVTQDHAAPYDLIVVSSLDEAKKQSAEKKGKILLITDKELSPVPAEIARYIIRPVVPLELREALKMILS